MEPQVLSESTIIILAVVGVCGTFATTLATLFFQWKTHRTFNSKMDKMLILVSDKAYKQGRNDQRAINGTEKRK